MTATEASTALTALTARAQSGAPVTRADAEQALTGLTMPDLRTVCDDLGIGWSGGRKPAVVARIVHLTVGAVLTSHAVSRMARS